MSPLEVVLVVWLGSSVMVNLLQHREICRQRRRAAYYAGALHREQMSRVCSGTKLERHVGEVRELWDAKRNAQIRRELEERE